MARTKHTWMAELMPGQSRTIPDTAANRMAVSYWRRRTGLPLRTRTLPNGQLLVERLDEATAVTAITLPVAALSPRACEVLAEELREGGEDALADIFAALYADLMGEPLALPSADESGTPG